MLLSQPRPRRATVAAPSPTLNRSPPPRDRLEVARRSRHARLSCGA